MAPAGLAPPSRRRPVRLLPMLGIIWCSPATGQSIRSAYVNTVSVAQTLTSKNVLGEVYMPDFVSPMILGNGDELGSGSSAPLNGSVDEFAIYTNVLSAVQVATNHYMLALIAAPATSLYPKTVLNDNPAIYARLDEPSFTGPSLASFSGCGH